MIKYCPDCGEKSDNCNEQDRVDNAYTNVFFKDVVILCGKCGLGWSCVGTKELNTS